MTALAKKLAGMRPLAEFQQGRTTPRTWVCSKCGTADRWRKGWAYYGSLEGLENGVIQEVRCPVCVPKNTRPEDTAHA